MSLVSGVENGFFLNYMYSEVEHVYLFSRPYLSNARAISMVVVVCPSVGYVTDVLWLSFKS